LSIHIRSLQEHVQRTLADTCQSRPVLLRTGPNNYIEYLTAYCIAAQIQQIGEKATAGVRLTTGIYFSE
jgi:hypothetical protein